MLLSILSFLFALFHRGQPQHSLACTSLSWFVMFVFTRELALMGVFVSSPPFPVLPYLIASFFPESMSTYTTPTHIFLRTYSILCTKRSGQMEMGQQPRGVVKAFACSSLELCLVSLFGENYCCPFLCFTISWAAAWFWSGGLMPMEITFSTNVWLFSADFVSWLFI